MKRFILFLLCLLAAPAACARADGAAPKLELRDGDRVVFVGSTFIEREQTNGYIETMLVSRFPGRHVTFRNVGYSGDTVAGDARGLCTGWSTFESPEQGMARLQSIVAELKPTVLIVNYGMNESFDGSEKSADFIAGLDKLINTLTTAAKSDGSAGVRQVLLLSPNYHEDMGRPLPDPAEHNRNLTLYSNAIGELATKRGYTFVDLFTVTEKLANAGHLTSNGIHLTPYGYWRVALAMERELGFGPRTVWLPPKEDASTPLPPPPPPEGSPSNTKSERLFKATSLESTGWFKLRFDSAQVKAEADALSEQWLVGMPLVDNAATAQAEELRKLIVAKNFDFFNYFRPENDSYILSFRKREQGRNAVELPKFKPFAEEKDGEIAKLSVPEAFKYSLVRVEGGK